MNFSREFECESCKENIMPDKMIFFTCCFSYACIECVKGKVESNKFFYCILCKMEIDLNSSEELNVSGSREIFDFLLSFEKDAQQKNKDFKNIEVSLLFNQKFIICPKCQISYIVEEDGLCNYINCPECNSVICRLCNAKLNRNKIPLHYIQGLLNKCININ